VLARIQEKRNPYTLLVGMQASVDTMGNNMEAPQKTRNRSAIRSSKALLGIYPKECHSGYNKGTCTPMFIAALSTIAKLWKQLRCPTTDEWIKKMWYLYTMEFYSAAKKRNFVIYR
jgi:hypothetical protein